MEKSYRTLLVLGVSVSLILLAVAVVSIELIGQRSAREGDVGAGSPIKIGAIYNLAGAQSSLDRPSASGAKLAVKEVNARGGIGGRELQLVLYDGKTDPRTIADDAHRLIETDRVCAIIGFSDTDMVLAAAPVAAEAGTVFLTSGATSPKLPAEVPEYLFLACFGDNVQAAAGAEYAYAHLGLRTAYLLVDEEMEYTRLLAAYFTARYTELGGAILREDSFQGGATNYAEQIRRLKALDPAPELLYIASGPESIGGIVKQFRAEGILQPIFGGDAYDTPELVRIAGAETSDVYFTTHALLDEETGTEGVRAFIAAYQAEYGVAPENAFAALGYDTVLLLADAIARAGSDDPEAIRRALAVTTNWEGVTGSISYEQGSRVPTKGVTIVSVMNGTLTYAGTIVPEKVPAP